MWCLFIAKWSGASYDEFLSYQMGEYIFNSFFTNTDLHQNDPELAAAIDAEAKRQQSHIEMIASENYTSPLVMAVQGSVLTNKYAEGYAGARYYNGCDAVDQAERMAIARACEMFGCDFANVQPHSGSQANQAVMLALLKPSDTILGMSLDAGGHLTHGSRVNMSGKWFNVASYGIDPQNGLIDMDDVRRLAQEHKPKMIICGASAYPQRIDFAAFRAIADEVDAYLLADVAHYAGLIVGGAYPSPFPHAHVVTTTTHKTLRGPRGGMILANDMPIGKSTLARKLNSAVFPGMQGGPLMHVIAAKAVAFGQALKSDFKDYAQSIVSQAKIFSGTLSERGLTLVTGGTESHIILLDLRPQAIHGCDVADALDNIGITVNKNGVPNDPRPPKITSGVRFGTAATATRALDDAAISELAHITADLVEHMASQRTEDGTSWMSAEVQQALAARVAVIAEAFPIYT